MRYFFRWELSNSGNEGFDSSLNKENALILGNYLKNAVVFFNLLSYRLARQVK